MQVAILFALVVITYILDKSLNDWRILAGIFTLGFWSAVWIAWIVAVFLIALFLGKVILVIDEIVRSFNAWWETTFPSIFDRSQKWQEIRACYRGKFNSLTALVKDILISSRSYVIVFVLSIMIILVWLLIGVFTARFL